MSNKYNRIPDFIKSLSEDELEELNSLLNRKKDLGIHDQLLCSNTVPLYDSGLAANISDYAKNIQSEIYSLNSVSSSNLHNKYISQLSEDERLHQINASYEAKWMYASMNAQLTQADIEINWAFKYGCSHSSYIDESHPDWNKAFNVFRRSQYLPSIKLEVGNIYVIQYNNGKIQRMKLVRIINPDGNFPECYFKDYMWPGNGSTNINIMKILNDVNETNEANEKE